MTSLSPFSLERVALAVALVRERLLRATAALEVAGVPYAVAGGNAVALWVARVDVTAVRNTSDIDLLVRRGDLEVVRAALTGAGFEYRHAAGLETFLDRPDGRVRDGIHLVFAGERVRATEAEVNPSVSESEPAEEYHVVTLPALVRMELTASRDKDRTHLRDLIDVGLVDAAWVSRLPGDLAVRLQALLDTPGG